MLTAAGACFWGWWAKVFNIKMHEMGHTKKLIFSSALKSSEIRFLSSAETYRQCDKNNLRETSVRIGGRRLGGGVPTLDTLTHRHTTTCWWFWKGNNDTVIRIRFNLRSWSGLSTVCTLQPYEPTSYIMAYALIMYTYMKGHWLSALPWWYIRRRYISCGLRTHFALSVVGHGRRPTGSRWAGYLR